RAVVLCETLRELARQTRIPDRIIVCGTCPDDVRGVDEVDPNIHILISSAGLTAQRNTVLSSADDVDLLVFFDDDFIPDPSYLSAIEKYMLADGISGPGYTFDMAHQILDQHQRCRTDIRPAFAAYGCNMAVRIAPVLQH